MKSGSALDKLKAAATTVQKEDAQTADKNTNGKSGVFVSPRSSAPKKDTSKEENDRRMMLPAPTVSIHQALNDLTPISVGQRTAIMNHLTYILSQDHLFSKAESEFYGGVYPPYIYSYCCTHTDHCFFPLCS